MLDQPTIHADGMSHHKEFVFKYQINQRLIGWHRRFPNVNLNDLIQIDIKIKFGSNTKIRMLTLDIREMEIQSLIGRFAYLLSLG